MESNLFLSPKTAADIDSRVARILKDLGNPDPPLSLDQVRDLLRLDRSFYSLDSPGIVSEVIHSLKVAGQQVLRRPTLLFEAIKKCDLKALFIQDRKIILLDASLPTPKQRWNEAHEVAHSIIPWHDDLAHGDQTLTLSRSCHLRVEAEANFGAARLLFFRELFRQKLLSSPVSMSLIRSLSKEFGNTMTTTFWRAIEALDIPAFGIVSEGNPRDDPSGVSGRYFVRSPKFIEQFHTASGPDLFREIKSYCRGRRGPIGSAERTLVDAVGGQHLFNLESFFNGYDTLTLGTYSRPESRLWIPFTA